MEPAHRAVWRLRGERHAATRLLIRAGYPLLNQEWEGRPMKLLTFACTYARRLMVGAGGARCQ